MDELNDKSDKPSGLTRRAFLGTGAGVGAASLLPAAQSQSTDSNPAAPERAAADIQRDVGASVPLPERAVRRPGSDLMVEVLRDLDIEFVAANPASSFEGLQESIINAGDTPNRRPEFIMALHEESSVDMAHGYAKAEGRPMAVMIHGSIGLMHASMALYQAYTTETPVVVIVGRDDTNFHRGQSANDLAGIVRAYTKWDDQPKTLASALDALQECYRQAVTPPCGPALVVIDTELQKQDAGSVQLPSFAAPRIRGIKERDAERIARALVAADNPHINCGRLRTPAGVASAIELAELVGASVSTRAWIEPMSFPQGHALCGPGASTDYDFELGLEAAGKQAAIMGPHRRTLDRDATGIGFGLVREPPTPIWGPYAPPAAGADDLVADAETSIPLIIAEAWNRLTPEQRRRVENRRTKHASANRTARAAHLRNALNDRRRGWNDSPISLARLYAELWSLIKDEDWCLASPTQFSGGHNRVFWEHNAPYSHLGMHGAGGLGYGIGASTGAALAARDRQRIVINVQTDGDLNYVPGSLWTAAHHRLPMLVVMHNNRAYHQELMYAQHVAGVRGRGGDRAHIGTTFRDPFISYAKLGEAYGVESEGPVDDPEELFAALERGVAAVKNGRPYLVDVLTQPR